MMEEFQRLQEIIERLKKDKDSAFLKVFIFLFNRIKG
jgi:hypothetical protein